MGAACAEFTTGQLSANNWPRRLSFLRYHMVYMKKPQQTSSEALLHKEIKFLCVQAPHLAAFMKSCFLSKFYTAIPSLKLLVSNSSSLAASAVTLVSENNCGSVTVMLTQY